MKHPLTAVNVFVIALGAFLVIEGFWGFFNPVVFGIFTTNILHAFIHLLLGFTGLYVGLRNHARTFSLYVGILLTVVGLLYLIPGADELIVRILNVNKAVAYFNIIAGIAAVLFAVLTPKRHPDHLHDLKHKHH